MAARDEHPAIPLILAIDVFVVKGGTGRSLKRLRCALDRHDPDACDQATLEPLRPVVAALPAAAQYLLEHHNPISTANYLASREGQFQLVSSQATAAMKAIRLSLPVDGPKRGARRDGQPEFGDPNFGDDEEGLF